MLKTILPLSFIAASRFFGLFVVLPTLSLYALKLEGATPELVGLIIGVYAISQMIFQLPFGALSDVVGRKRVMYAGLLIFVIGSLVCAVASDIYTMIAGRMMQGMGAIGGVASAMVADSVSEEKRSKAMAIMGAMIGLAFIAAMVVGPLLSASWGLEGLFYLSAAISVLCMLLLLKVPQVPVKKQASTKAGIKEILENKNLLILNLTSFLQKMLMSVLFLVIPVVLVNHLGLEASRLWQVYAAAALLGFLAMGMAGALGDKRGLAKTMLIVGVGCFGLAFVIFAMLGGSVAGFIAGVLVFFVGFNLHEPIMQSCASKFCKHDQRGKALGLFTSCGYAGSFAGGAIGGLVLAGAGELGLYGLCFVLCLGWMVLLARLKNPKDFANIYIENLSKQYISDKLSGVNGVYDIYDMEQKVAIKIDLKAVSRQKIEKILG